MPVLPADATPVHVAAAAAGAAVVFAGAAVTLAAAFRTGERSEVRVHVKDAAFDPAVAAFRSAVEAHHGHPTSCTVFHDGSKVLELASGDVPNGGGAFGPDHVSTVQSLSKVVLGLAVAILEDRGHLSYDDTVRSHWPEFQHAGITVRQLMSHTAGLHKLAPATQSMATFADRDAAAAFLAAQPSKLGLSNGSDQLQIRYSALVSGWYVSQLIKRADPKGRYLAEFAREEIFEKLGLEPWQMGFGFPDATVGRPHPLAAPSDEALHVSARRYVTHPQFAVGDLLAAMWLPAWLQRWWWGADTHPASLPPLSVIPTCLPLYLDSEQLRGTHLCDITTMLAMEAGSANLITNTHALGVLGNCLAVHGGAPLLSSRAALSRAAAEASAGWDGVYQCDATFSNCGWSSFCRLSTRHCNVRAWGEEQDGLVGWWGQGGQLFVFSPSRRLAFAFQSTYLGLQWNGLDIPAVGVLDAVLACASANAAP